MTAAAQKSPVRGPDGRYTRATVRWLDRDWPDGDDDPIGAGLARELAEREQSGTTGMASSDG